ncbi:MULTISPECIES: hypothetical protein [Micromonospora]|uniref:Uncharacterized protein n=1 Tax=Micromonospora vinacea TaxID=709878 RepID=A0ABS0JW08_9ACTN|nr:hypothetical protein [Micromonospora vinacea]MBG6100544.1 hypothetical protein [Micromonospora vinacea]WSZ76527.1 hypothetical protein OH804_32485 [Micromonospora sp. NBC_00860]WTA66989.1 hypothetical protein OHB51_31850 [Micromonospora sp. NBC_00855]
MDCIEVRCWLDWWANYDLDPVFTLRFADGDAIDVTVRPSADHRRFTLTQ